MTMPKKVVWQLVAFIVVVVVAVAGILCSLAWLFMKGLDWLGG